MRRWPLYVFGAVAGVPLGLFGLSLALTPPLEPPRPEQRLPLPRADRAVVEAAAARTAAVAWPEEVLTGPEAKALLLEVLLAVEAGLEAQTGYTATFRKQERVDGKLQPEQTMAMKVRHRPFAIYLKFLHPDAGKEVIYHTGRYDDHIVAHGGKLTRLLLPRLKVPPNSPLAMKGNRHPVTDAGLLNLVKKLVRFRRMDLTDHDAETVLDRVTDEKGRTYLRSAHAHPHKTGDRPFAYVEVLYDPQTRIPVQFEGFDWPESGVWRGERILGERYVYEDVDFEAELTDLDFDPANPAYEFRRF
jgi:hypothetical protein